MAHLFDNHPDDDRHAGDLNHPEELDYQTPPAPRRKRWVTIAVAAALLAVIGGSSAVLWRTYGGSLPALPSLPSFASTTEPAAAPAVAEKPVGTKDFQALQQQIAGSAQSTAQLLAAQQAELKRLADQVAVLTAKVDLLERPAATAQASLPAAQPAPPPAPRKRPAAPKQPAPAISVGGAPLPPPR